MSLKAVSKPSASNYAAPVGGKLVSIGDSRLANAIGVALAGANGYSTYAHQRGYINHFQAMANYPFTHHFAYAGSVTPCLGHNAGIGSEETKDWIARFDRDVGSQRPSVVLIEGPTNDLTSADSLTQDHISNNIQILAKKAMALGAHVILMAISPRHNVDGKAFTAPQEAARIAINLDTAALAAAYPGKVTFIYLDDVLIDHATGLMNVAYCYDGLHYNSNGANVVAMKLMSWWLNFGGTGFIKRGVPLAYDVTLAPYGNLLTNTAFTGTGGTISTGASGTAPDSWRAERQSGSTVTAAASIVSQANWNGETTNFVQMVYSGLGTGADGELFRLRPTATSFTAGVVAGQWYVAEVEVIIGAHTGTDPLRSLYVEARDLAGDDSFNRCFATGYTYVGGVTVKDILPATNGGLRYILRTPPLRADDNVTGITFYLVADLDGTTTGTKTLQWAQPTFIPITTPDYGQNKYIEVDGSGTAYALTATPAAVTLGTTSPSITLPECGTYIITYNATLDYVAATFAASRAVTLKATRTNFTQADLTGSTTTLNTAIITTITNTFMQVAKTFEYTCTCPGEIISLFGSVSVVPTAGALNVTTASIVAERMITN